MWADISPDYTCFEVPDEFVVGYGLILRERYRNLPYVGVLKPEIYEKITEYGVVCGRGSPAALGGGRRDGSRPLVRNDLTGVNLI